MRYLQRSIKYFLALCCIYIAMIYLSSYIESVLITPGQQFRALISTPRGVFLIVAMFLLAAAYPSFGFMRRFMVADIVAHRDLIIKAFRMQGMVLDHESEGRMTFISESKFKRVTMLFEDHVKVIQQSDGRIAVSGNRKLVAYTLYRLEALIPTSEEVSE